MATRFYIDRSLSCCVTPFPDVGRQNVKLCHSFLLYRGFSEITIHSHTVASSAHSRKQQRKDRASKAKFPHSKKIYIPSPTSTANSRIDKKIQIDEKDETESEKLAETSKENISIEVEASEGIFSGHNNSQNEGKLDQLETSNAICESEPVSPIRSISLESMEEHALSSTTALETAISAINFCESQSSRNDIIEPSVNLENLSGDKGTKESLRETNDLAYKKLLHILALMNYSRGTKVFTYPEVAKAGHDIEVFLNRDTSTLKGQQNVHVMGAFNNWRWHKFTTPLQRTDLQGDWWSCRVHIPKEAYQMDFVFFNGDNVYENNDSLDFTIHVKGGMDIFDFEDLLLEKERRKIEKLAADKAEKEKQASERRRTEEEKAAIEADKSQAKHEVDRRREILSEMMKKAVKSVPDVWYIEPSHFKGGDKVEICYNRGSGPLVNSKEVWIHGGHNNWQYGLTIVRRLESSEKVNGDWWSANVTVPEGALILDWVFTDGPPERSKIYDNNHRQDFHAVVPQLIPEGLYWVEVEHQIYTKLPQERKLKEEAKKLKAERTAHMKEEMKQRTLQMFRLSQKHVVFTEPFDVQAGHHVTVFYNPSTTVLNGRTDIWFRCAFNRWTHRLGPLPPQKMVHTDDSSFLKAAADWWNSFGQETPHLKNFAIRVLNLTCSASGCERNWSTFSMVHSKRRNRLQQEKMNALVFVMYNMKLRERHIKRSAHQDPIRLDHIDSDDEWIVEREEPTLPTQPNWLNESWLDENFDIPLQEPTSVAKEGGNEVEGSSKVVAYKRRKVASTSKVKVPLDAYSMDFVFSERVDGGIYDNRNGMDYHVPVFDGITREPPMHIVHIAVEMAPIAKVGGLGDVVTSLSRAVRELGHNVEIILPKYNCLNLNNVKDMMFLREFGLDGTQVKVWFGTVESLPVYFIDPQNGMFSSHCIYVGLNDGERFSLFCRAALEFLLKSGSRPDILHCHDWSSAPASWIFKENYRHGCLSNARVVFTIHNLEFGAILIGKAMVHADKATTVSHTYSKEVAGNPAISPHLCKFHGILNGIDPDIWDPYNDPFIPVPYTSENVVEGKAAAKAVLQQRANLSKSDLPLVGIITRLTVQKGIHLIKHAIWRTLEHNGQVVLLGSAPDPRVQDDFVNLANQLHNTHSNVARLFLTYNEPLSHLIYAGADFILVPSIYEPCGLTQLTAMRYGAIPIVRRTGGLHDTIFDVEHDKERAQSQGLVPNGFSFEGADVAGIDYALNRGISAWYDAHHWFNSLRKQVMEQDWSWNRPALDYMELYHSARK